MKARKFFALVLSAALCLGLVSSALAAAASSQQELTEVTARVKAALELDTELFEDFQGQAREDVLLGKRWSLEWSGDGVSLSITADSNGKVYSYNFYESVSDEQPVDSWYMGGRMNIPRLPQDKSAAAFAAAEDFLGKVLESPVETVELEDNYAPSLRQSSYRYAGTVLLNGYTSPVQCSVTVRSSDLRVTRFWRGDESAGYLGGVPAPAKKAAEVQARRDLRNTLNMEARFVLTEDGKTARVRYVPTGSDEYYVDGASGQLVNLTELRQALWRSGAGNAKYNFMATDSVAAAPEAAGDAGLTQAEKEGAAILAEAHSKEELDRIVKNTWPEIGLDRYTLSAARYSVTEKPLEKGVARTSEDYDVTCLLTYGKQDGQVLRNKLVWVDAKTGVLQSLSSRRWYQGEGEDTYRRTLSLTQAKEKAAEFLTSYAGAHYAALGLKTSNDAEANKTWEHTCCYQQTDGTYFYDGNFYTVGIDATDGTLSSLSWNFDDDVVLSSPKTVLSAGDATAVYGDAMELAYGYLEVPVSISLAPGDVMPLLKEAGYAYVLSLKTGYVLRQPEKTHLLGVDAETGEVISSDLTLPARDDLTYDDLDGHWVQTAAQALALFRIGLRGGSLKPEDALTQLDMVALLSSVDGYEYDPATATQEETDRLYSHAYSMGIVTPETREEGKSITRGELVRLILDAAGFARVAALPGIFRCSFSDSASIGESDIGYAALAQGLGLVKGGSDGSYAAHRSSTRAEAIAMLYQYMK